MSPGKRSTVEHTTSSGSRASEGGGTVHGFNQRNGKVHSSFRISPLVEVFNNLSAAKEKVLEKMRFNGLLSLPKDETNSDRPFKLRFAFSLLIRLDSDTGHLDLGRHGRIEVAGPDVTLVLGIPSWGEELDVHDPSRMEMNKAIIRRNLMLHSDEEIDLIAIKKVLQRDILDSADDALAKAYMTAVVIYTVSCFLAPKGRPPRVNTEIFDSIIDPGRILKINWSSYVLRTLRDSSAKIKSDIRSGKSSVCLDGCLLFLQILYLDNVKLGPFTTCQYRWPRVADFTYTRLKEMISADKRQGANKGDNQYTLSELRHPAESFYNRGVVYRQKLERLTSAYPKLPSEYEIDKVMKHIDEQNMEHKREIMHRMVAYAKEMCDLSDKHFGEVKNMVSRWMSIGVCKEKDCSGKVLREMHGFTSGSSQGAGVSGEGCTKPIAKCHLGEGPYASTARRQDKAGKSGVDKPFENEVVDLTGSDNEGAISEQKERGGHAGKDAKWDKSYINLQAQSFPGTNTGATGGEHSDGGEPTAPPQRCGTKRAANRTPLAVRQACLVYDHDGDDYDEIKWGYILKHRCTTATLTGEQRDLAIPSRTGLERPGRTKHMAHKSVRVPRRSEETSPETSSADTCQ